MDGINKSSAEIARLWIEGVPMPMVVIGPDGRVIAQNAPAGLLLGGDWSGRHHITVLRQPETLDAIESTIADNRARTVGYHASDASFDVSVTALRQGQGVVLCFMDRSRDDEVTNLRSSFVANVSHELRTPLTALMGFIETLKGPARDDPQAQARFLDIMEQEAGRMSRLIDDLLSLSRVEADERIRPTGSVDVGKVLRAAADSIGPLCEASGATLVLEGLDENVVVPGDADQLRQVVLNLLENAIKYGGKRITAGVQFDEQLPILRGPGAVIEVADDGPGIASWHIPRLTERFYRVDTHRSRDAGGTGLGLAIVKHIVQRHRGRLRIESAEGRGSRFRIFLPAAPGAETPAE